MAEGRWYGAGGPAYYMEENGRVVAILFWLDTTIASDSDEDEIDVVDAGWYVVLTSDGGKYHLDEAPALTGLDDESQVEAINETVEAAARLIREEG